MKQRGEGPNFPPLLQYFTEMCSGSEAGSYLRLIDIVHHSAALDLRAEKKRTEHAAALLAAWASKRARFSC